MRTPKAFEEMLKSGLISEEVIGACLYSINKRAKNCRDREQESRRGYHRRFASDAHEKKMEFYRMKDELLSYFHPLERHIDGMSDYYYYEIGGYKFHQPTSRRKINEPLPTVTIPGLMNPGKDVSELVSLQFCKKVIDALETKRCHIFYTDAKPNPLMAQDELIANKDLDNLFEKYFGEIKKGDRS